MEELDQPQNQLDTAYEVEYYIDDKALFEPFAVFKPKVIVGYAWWNGEKGREKVLKLFDAIKSDLIVKECCLYAGISDAQYKYFCTVHPHFLPIKPRLKAVMAVAVKMGVVTDVQTKGKDGMRARQWYLERRQPELYGRDIGAYAPPPASAATRVTGEAYLDEDGKVLVSRQTQEALNQEYGPDQDGEGKPE